MIEEAEINEARGMDMALDMDFILNHDFQAHVFLGFNKLLDHTFCGRFQQILVILVLEILDPLNEALRKRRKFEKDPCMAAAVFQAALVEICVGVLESSIE